jgi:signal peptidase I
MKILIVISLSLAVLLLGCSENMNCSFVYKNKDSVSMHPTLFPGASVCVNSDFRFQDLSRFDLIVMKSPSSQFEGVQLARRVLAFGGEELSIHQHGMTIDGQRIDLPEVLMDSLGLDAADHLKHSIFKTYKVPVGEIFVIGDNIFRAIDSTEFSSIDESLYLGKILRIED